MKYLIVYNVIDLQPKEKAKICNGEKEVEEVINYLKFLNASNIKIYLVDFENELITKVAE